MKKHKKTNIKENGNLIGSLLTSPKKSTEKVDVYVLPQVFVVKTKVEATSPNGMELENEVTPSRHNSSHEISLSKDVFLRMRKKDNLKSTRKTEYNLYRCNSENPI